MLIGFSGASGSGKTTLIRKVADKLHCGVVDEVARVVFEDWKQKYGFETLSEVRMYYPTKFQLEVLRKQIADREGG